MIVVILSIDGCNSVSPESIIFLLLAVPNVKVKSRNRKRRSDCKKWKGRQPHYAKASRGLRVAPRVKVVGKG